MTDVTDLGSVDHRNHFVIPVHKRLVYDACEANLFGGIVTQNIMAGLMDGKHTWLHHFCKALATGAEWPDCPTSPEKASMRLNCIEVPGIGPIPFHEGMVEMTKQAVMGELGLVHEASPNFSAYEMSAMRAAVQHEHASPLLPLHLPDGRHIALVSNRQFRGKMVRQALEWHCKASFLIHKGLTMKLPFRKDSSRKTEKMRRARKKIIDVGLAFAGKILHMVGDSFSMSHSRRLLNEASGRADYFNAERRVLEHQPSTEFDVNLLRQASIDFAYTMDDVTWGKHKVWDSITDADKQSPLSDKRSMYALAHIATRMVLSALYPLFDDFYEAAPAASNMTVSASSFADRNPQIDAHTRCGETVRGAVPRILWPDHCLCLRGTTVNGDHAACKAATRTFRASVLKDHGCYCEDEAWSGLCFASLRAWRNLSMGGDCSERGGMSCSGEAGQNVCLPLTCEGHMGLVEKTHVRCEQSTEDVKADGRRRRRSVDTTSEDAVAPHSLPSQFESADRSRIALGRILCNDVLTFKSLDAGAGGSSSDVGRNGNASNWRAQLADDEDTRNMVAEKLSEIIRNVDVLRKGKRTFTDSKIPFAYPGPNDVDICDRLEDVTCGELAVDRGSFLNEYRHLHRD